MSKQDLQSLWRWLSPRLQRLKAIGGAILALLGALGVTWYSVRNDPPIPTLLAVLGVRNQVPQLIPSSKILGIALGSLFALSGILILLSVWRATRQPEARQEARSTELHGAPAQADPLRGSH